MEDIAATEDDSSSRGLSPEIVASLKNVFDVCDEDKSGLVQVSKFASFLQDFVDDGGKEILPYINDLEKLLDPTGENVQLDWRQCEARMAKWIQLIHDKKFDADGFTQNNILSSPARGAINLAWLSPGRPTKRSMSFPKERASVTSVTTTYSNDSQQELQDMSWDNGFMMSRIEDLENSNKRLVDDNANLKNQLENYEDLNASVVTKNEEMKRKLLRYEDVIDENKELLKINDELKLSNSDMHTMNMKLTT